LFLPRYGEVPDGRKGGTLSIRRRPRQPHPGTRIIRYRCFLPDLAEFTNYRRGGTDGATIKLLLLRGP